MSQRTASPLANGSAKGLSCILNDRKTVLRCQRLETVIICRQSEQIGGHDGFGTESSGFQNSLNSIFQIPGIHVEGNRINVHKYRLGACQTDDIGCCNICEIRCETASPDQCPAPAAKEEAHLYRWHR